ncbi:MAG TPA: sigma-70 family RNA polymerase sigma factor [Vicinamibacterales bacterium]|jgi:RNA polymerase sigma-70 factor (ECF subfamily)|nr:sigma-70 family RNA polymerase sigma factor [Vicinamibacterales bacterium]
MSKQEMQWVLRAQCHDREALGDLLRSVQPSLRGYLSAVAGQTDADDLQQDVLILVVRRLGSLEDPALFRPWLFRIASREAFRHVKKRRLWQGRHEDDAQLENFPAQETPPSGDLLRTLLATETISPTSRAVLILHFQEELPLHEVAAILEIPLGTAKSRLAYGLRSIRKHLNGSGGSHD